MVRPLYSLRVLFHPLSYTLVVSFTHSMVFFKELHLICGHLSNFYGAFSWAQLHEHVCKTFCQFLINRVFGNWNDTRFFCQSFLVSPNPLTSYADRECKPVPMESQPQPWDISSLQTNTSRFSSAAWPEMCCKSSLFQRKHSCMDSLGNWTLPST